MGIPLYPITKKIGGVNFTPSKKLEKALQIIAEILLDTEEESGFDFTISYIQEILKDIEDDWYAPEE